MSAADYPQVVYLWGDDSWSMDRIVGSIAARLSEATGAPPDRVRLNGKETDAAEISGRTAVAPMFGGGAVVVVSDAGPLVRSKDARRVLDGVIATVAPGNALVFLEFDTTNGKKRPKSLTDLADAIVKAGGTVRPCRAPSAGEMAAWITGRAEELDIKLAPDAAKELAKRIGSGLSEGDVDRRLMSAMAVGELEKLALYRDGEPVTADDVRALVAEVVPDSLWALTDAIARRRTEWAGPALDRALEAHPEPVLVVMLHRRLREVLVAADARARGLPPPELLKLIGGSPWVAQQRAQQAAAWTVPELEDAIEGLLDLDRMMKHADVATVTDGQRRMAWTTWVAERIAPSGRPSGAAGRATTRGQR